MVDRIDAPTAARRGLDAAWCAAFIGVAGAIQCVIPGFFDGDTGYHLAVARLTAEHGILREFPWTPYAWQGAHYADKELLFHWLLVPIAGLSPVVASRIAGTALGAALLATLYLLLRRERVSCAGLWSLASLAISSAFVVRFAMVRPHLLSIPLALGILWTAARGRRWPLALLCAVYPLAYTAWHLPLALLGIAVLSRWLADRTIDWQSPAVGTAALLAGISIHPNFPATADLFWLQNATILFGTAWQNAAGVDLGGEFGAFSASGWMRYVLPTAVLVGGAVYAAVRAPHRDALRIAFAIAALGFLALTCRTQRFIEYAAPFGVAAAALGWQALDVRPARLRLATPALFATACLWTALFGRHPLQLLMNRIDAFPSPVVELLQQAVPEGAQVVTCDWRQTGEMLLALPERRFIVALDPMFLAAHDPERYRIWYDTVRHPGAAPALRLRDTFEASFVVCGEQERWRGFHAALEADPAARLRGTIGLWRVYQLRPPAFDSPSQAPGIAAR